MRLNSCDLKFNIDSSYLKKSIVSSNNLTEVDLEIELIFKTGNQVICLNRQRFYLA